MYLYITLFGTNVAEDDKDRSYANGDEHDDICSSTSYPESGNPECHSQLLENNVGCLLFTY
jgi:hypothetical protein